MSYTKENLINDAFDAMGLSSYVFQLKPEDYQSALRKLNSMMAGWYSRGIILPYPNDAELDSETNLPDWAIEAVYSNLAVRIAPAFGKTISDELRRTALESMQAVLIKFGGSLDMQFPETLPKGAGNRSDIRRDYFSEPYGPLQPWDK